MQLFPSNPDTIRKVALFVQSLQLWALELVALWVELVGGRNGRIDLRRRLRRLRRDTRIALMIAVVARMRMRKGPIVTTRPRSCRRGARYQLRRTRWLRMITRGIRLDTLADIRAALDDFEAHVAHAFARLPKRLLAGALVSLNIDCVVRAPLRVVSANADAHDTS